MKYPYIVVYKNNKYIGIFSTNDINDKCEDLKKLIGKDYIYRIMYSSIKFEESKKTCKNNLLDVEKELKLV